MTYLNSHWVAMANERDKGRVELGGSSPFYLNELCKEWFTRNDSQPGPYEVFYGAGMSGTEWKTHHGVAPQLWHYFSLRLYVECRSAYPKL